MVDHDSKASEPLVSPEDDGKRQMNRSKNSIRLISVDVLRGLTIALMIFVDYCGESWAAIDHCPWDGIRLADFVMPSFDFIVGISVVMSQRTSHGQQESKFSRFRVAFTRAGKLFLLGILTQAGTPFPTYDLKHLRIMGILQRVSLCYLTAACAEIFVDVEYTSPSQLLRENRSSRGTIYFETLKALDLHWKRRFQWMIALCLIIIHTSIMYGVDTGKGCGRGNTSPDCNAAGYVDSKILGVSHMYFPTNGGSWDGKEVTFQRTSDCSTCSPGRCAPPPDAPEWCGYDDVKGGAPFDPEGLVSSLTAVVAALLGAHVGAAVKYNSASSPGEGSSGTSAADKPAIWYSKYSTLIHWLALGLIWVTFGGILVAIGVPLNTDLYSVSFLFVTTGAACVTLCACSFSVDDYLGTRKGDEIALWARPFRWLGLNSILIYLFSCTGIVQSFLTCFYFGNTEHNLENVFYPTGFWWGLQGESSFVPTSKDADKVSYDGVAVILWCIFFYIPFWIVVAGYLHRIKFYLKI
jgi:predicted acyltransferase